MKSFETAISYKLDYIVQAVDDFNLITNVQEENKKLKESLEALSNKHSTLINVASDLNTRIKNLENERSSLLTAIKPIYCDRGDHAAPESVKNLPDSDQSVILNNFYEPPNLPGIDLENTKENESVKRNSVLAKSKRKRQN